MSHLARILAARKKPRKGRSHLELIIPQGPCHPVVGGTYDEQYQKQLKKVTTLIAGSQPLPELSRDGMPSVEEWDSLRSRPTPNAESQFVSQGSQGTEQTIKYEKILVHLLDTNYEGATALISSLWSHDAKNIGRLASTSKALKEAVSRSVVSFTPFSVFMSSNTNMSQSRFHMPSRNFNFCDFTEYTLVQMAERPENVSDGLHKHLVVIGKDLLALAAPITGIPTLWESDDNRDRMWAWAESQTGSFAMTVKLAPYYATERRLLTIERHLSAKQQSLGQVAVRAPTHHHLREATCTIPLRESFPHCAQYG